MGGIHGDVLYPGHRCGHSSHSLGTSSVEKSVLHNVEKLQTEHKLLILVDKMCILNEKSKWSQFEQ